MGGKSYYCDYCCCFMKNDLNVRKLHNAGLSHTTAKVTYMRRFEDPRKTLVTESKKKPCSRYLAGYCKFQLTCSFGHYSEKQLKQLEKMVRQRNRRKKNTKRSKNQLPPSLQAISLNKLKTNTNLHLGWGQ